MKKSRPHRSSIKPSSAPSPSHTLRIIGGQWRGRKLSFVGAEGLRPTGDRIRETLFNWLMPDLPSARCLDVFSGSGALGLEALSRGAATATLLELHPQAAAQIRQHLRLLGCTQGEVVQTNSITWLLQAPRAEGYDVVFIDPPFEQDLWQATVDALEQRNWLNEGAAIYIETPRQLPLLTPAHWHLHREKHAGDVTFRLYYREAA